jgi:hypothetical protein
MLGRGQGTGGGLTAAVPDGGRRAAGSCEDVQRPPQVSRITLGGQSPIEFMASVFVTKTRRPDLKETDNQRPHAHITFGGVYFFLYPAILRLRDQTGELIDPQIDAFFDGATLDELERFVSESRHRVLAEPNVWEQRVGVSLPVGEPRHERTSQALVLDLLDQIDRAILLARKRGSGLLFMGE